MAGKAEKTAAVMVKDMVHAPFMVMKTTRDAMISATTSRRSKRRPITTPTC